MANYVSESILRDDLPSALQSLSDPLLRRHLDEMETFVFRVLGVPPPDDPMAVAIIRDLTLARFLERTDKERAKTLTDTTLAWLERYTLLTSFPGVEEDNPSDISTLIDNIFGQELWDPVLDFGLSHIDRGYAYNDDAYLRRSLHDVYGDYGVPYG